MTEVTSSYSGDGFASGASRLDKLPDAPGSKLFSSGAQTKHPFDVVRENRQTVVKRGEVMCGTFKTAAAEEITVEDDFTGSVYLLLDWSSGSFVATLETEATSPDPEDKKAERKLYDFEDGKVTMDYRQTPVFVVYN